MVWEGLSQSEMPGLDAIILMNDFSLLYASNEKITHTREHLNELFGKKYPRSFHPDCVNYYEDSPEELAMINYTSGTSGFSKGVMLPYRSILSNVLFGFEVHGHLDNASNCVSMLPTAHMYGMLFEFLVEFCLGCHVHFLTRLPTPKIILDAMGSIKPDLIVTVPLVIEKIYKKKLEPIINRRDIRLLLRLPVIDEKILKKVQPRGRGLLPPYRIPLHGGLRHDRVRPHHHVCPLESDQALLLRQGGSEDAGHD